MNTFVSFVLERFKFDYRMNENHTVAAGLTFSAQLLSLLSACFDTLLPKRLHFSDFGIPSKTEFKFYKLISRLNLVILNLLLSMLTRPLYCEHRLIKNFHFFFRTSFICASFKESTLQSSGPNSFYTTSMFFSITLRKVIYLKASIFHIKEKAKSDHSFFH